MSATFHGRDVFAPVAARLAAGAPLREAGDPLEPAALVPLALPRPRRTDGGLVATVAGADGFGNVAPAAPARGDLDAAGLRPGAAVAVEAGGRARPGDGRAHVRRRAAGRRARSTRTPSGAITVAVNRGDAAALLGVGPGDELAVRRSDAP